MKNTYHILHVEDCSLQRELVQKIFFDQKITYAKSSKEAKILLDNDTFNLILLDVMLEDGDSYALCQHIKNDARHGDTPLMMISGKGEVNDKVMGLDYGADDYVTKPFNFLELKARVQSLLRRTEKKSRAQQRSVLGPFELDSENLDFHIVEGSQRTKVHLSASEFKLLQFLMKHADQIVSRDQILHTVWGNTINVTDRSVDAKISKLRKKLGAHGEWLNSIYGLGYRLARPDILKQSAS